MKKRKCILAGILALAMLMTAPIAYAAEDPVNTTAPEAAQETQANKDAQLLAAKAPSGDIKVSSYSYDKIKVSWGEMPGYEGYEIYRAISKSGKYTKVTTVGSDKTEYINGKRTPGKTYWYKVRGVKTVSGKKVYSKYSQAKSAYARPNKPVLNKEYDMVWKSGWNLILTWESVSGASGYQLQMRDLTVNGKWQENHSGKNGYVYPIQYDKTTAYRKFDGTHDYEMRVRAYRTVNGKRVYGLFSEVQKLEAKVDEKIIHDAMVEYIKAKYPQFDFYYTKGGEPLTDDNGSYGFEWGKASRYIKYESVQHIMSGDNGNGLNNVIDEHIRKWFTEGSFGVDSPQGAGSPYVKQVDGYYQVWMLF